MVGLSIRSALNYPLLSEMADQHLLKGATAVIATACILLLSLPALKALVGRIGIRRGYKPVDTRYTDEDGEATEESTKVFSDLGPRLAVYLGVLHGLGTSVSSKVLAGRTSLPVWATIVAWSGVVSWVGAAI